MPGANLTKKALSDSMKRLMNSTPFEKISVVNICETCGINRKSFYYHFQDKYDLVEWIFYTEYMECINNVDESSSWDYVAAICEYFYNNKKFYINAFGIDGQNSFAETFNENLSILIDEYLEQTIADPKMRDFLCTMLSDTMRCTIIRWLKGDNDMNVKQLVAIFQSLQKNIAESYLASQGENDQYIES